MGGDLHGPLGAVSAGDLGPDGPEALALGPQGVDPAGQQLLDLVGPGVGGQVDVPIGQVPADQQVPDHPADQVEAAVGRGEALGQWLDHVEHRLEGQQQPLGDHIVSVAAACAAATARRTSRPGPAEVGASVWTSSPTRAPTVAAAHSASAVRS